ncbi:hypothetical protein E2C01_089296 [Portunus trituberculatus]|uniref:Uncharacterized protein n=1 Tax=Portunus trituberculatus TaxID=210409 RepID=A0A5B7JIF3_PORTR|nr:hypothetical protein [Portunus trituberculatus]
MLTGVVLNIHLVGLHTCPGPQLDFRELLTKPALPTKHPITDLPPRLASTNVACPPPFLPHVLHFSSHLK